MLKTVQVGTKVHVEILFVTSYAHRLRKKQGKLDLCRY
ncbi:Uncharacterized protein BC05F1_05035 [Bacillus wiedmannii]|uniref:Uncharacterized protein n=2 Tax=Bacillus cereus group TaxID=86661 RepID=A0A0G8EMQ9_BACCE|nr:hypothetical protein B4077_4773 [Bacillus cereus]SCC60843.1 Uncharacterized protein BC05F1_05035 [Bacillus wiedmannii]SCN08474.1 Uncharacterized protein BCINRASA_04887 [Bacillus wiedmannii]